MSWDGVITTAGRDLLAAYASGEASVNVDSITVGDLYVSESDMRSATGLQRQKDTGSILKKTPVEGGVDFQFQIGPCANGGYRAHEIGMWANTTTGSSVLLALFQNTEGVYIPDSSTNPNFLYILNVVLAINNLETLTITVNPNAFVPFSEYTPFTEDVEAALAEKVDKETGKGLSHNDFTDAYKDKLDGIESQANKYVLPIASSSQLGGVKVGTGLAINSGILSNSGVRSVQESSQNGKIKVNTNGISSDVPVHGLGSAAFENKNNLANKEHTHSADDITSGTLPLGRGGTGASLGSSPSMIVNLESGSNANVFQSSPKPGVTGVLPITKGGTGKASAPEALVALGAATVDHTHTMSNISGTLPVNQGGTNATTPEGARANLGAAASGHKHSASDINSGTLAIARGGTGVSLDNTPAMLTNLGSTSADTPFKASPRPGVTGTLQIGNGGTGLTSSPQMLVNLGNTTKVNVLQANPEPGIKGTLPIDHGGTGATTKADALTSLGAAASGHKHSGSDINSGKVGVSYGGTGIGSEPSMIVNLESGNEDTIYKAKPKPGVTGTLPIGKGGTGLASNPSMLVDLSKTSRANVFQSKPEPGIKGTLPIGYGGTNATTADAARANLGAAAADHTHTPASIGAAATNHTHNFPDIVPGGFKKMGMFEGDGTKKRFIEVGFNPTRVVVFAMSYGYSDYIDDPTGITMQMPHVIPMTFCAEPGWNCIETYHESATKRQEYLTTTNLNKINEYFDLGRGGMVVYGNGFYVGRSQYNLYGESEMIGKCALNAVRWAYLWLAWG